MSITITKEMMYGMRYIKDWYNSTSKNKQSHVDISGPAGSGKTTFVEYIIESLGLETSDVLFVAMTGKATTRMIMNNVPAKTIHSVIYNPFKAQVKDKNGKLLKDDNGEPITTIRFGKVDELPDNIKLIVVDEGSMVSENIGKDLESFGVPIIVLGDLNQLPPVSGKSYFLKKPDIFLTQVFRQDNEEIIYLSQKAIVGERLQYGRYGETCLIMPANMMGEDELSWGDVIICGKNSTRDELNNFYRKTILNIPTNDLVLNDKIICRKNNYSAMIQNSIFLVNGLSGNVSNIDHQSFTKKVGRIDFKPDFINDTFDDIMIDNEYLMAPYSKRSDMPMKDGARYEVINRFEYAYAISAHLSQGSEYNNVVIRNEYMGSKDYYNKWLYTAITRAKEGLIIGV